MIATSLWKSHLGRNVQPHIRLDVQELRSKRSRSKSWHEEKTIEKTESKRIEPAADKVDKVTRAQAVRVDKKMSESSKPENKAAIRVKPVMGAAAVREAERNKTD